MADQTAIRIKDASASIHKWKAWAVSMGVSIFFPSIPLPSSHQRKIITWIFVARICGYASLHFMMHEDLILIVSKPQITDIAVVVSHRKMRFSLFSQKAWREPQPHPCVALERNIYKNPQWVAGQRCLKLRWPKNAINRGCVGANINSIHFVSI